MIIDDDVAAAARQFGLDPKLIQAVVVAEGNILKAVQCSIPSIKSREKALEVTCRSAAHAMSDFIKRDLVDLHGESLPAQFVSYWGARWAPRGAQNDPTDLNKNWPRNVLKLWVGK